MKFYGKLIHIWKLSLPMSQVQIFWQHSVICWEKLLIRLYGKVFLNFWNYGKISLNRKTIHPCNDYLFFSVDAYVSQWGNSCPRESFKTSLADRSKDLLEKLKKCGIGQRPVIFVGHSMGGLVAKKMLLQVPKYI